MTCGLELASTKQEFFLVIGLRFGTLLSIATDKYVSVDVRIHERYFGQMDILGTTLQERFTEQNFQQIQDAAKMTLVIFMSSVFIGPNYKKKVSS